MKKIVQSRLFLLGWNVPLGILVGLAVLGIDIDEYGADIPGYPGYVAVMFLAAIISWCALWNVDNPRREKLALAIVVLCGFSYFSVPASVYALIRMVAKLRLGWTLAAVAGIALSFVPELLSPVSDTDLFSWDFVTSLMVASAPILFAGIVIGRRRIERERREDELVRRERDRIALDLHDSLSHRLSLISVYSSALAYRELSADKIRASAQTIQTEAEAAVADLREILKAVKNPSNPNAGIEELVDEARAAGDTVAFNVDKDVLCDFEKLSTSSRQAFIRGVRECLVNARKHAPGKPVDIAMKHDQGHFMIRIANESVESLGTSGGTSSSTGDSGAELEGTGAEGAGSRLGLEGIRRRFEALGGYVNVYDGAEFVVELALDDTTERAA